MNDLNQNDNQWGVEKNPSPEIRQQVRDEVKKETRDLIYQQMNQISNRFTNSLTIFAGLAFLISMFLNIMASMLIAKANETPLLFIEIVTIVGSFTLFLFLGIALGYLFILWVNQKFLTKIYKSDDR